MALSGNVAAVLTISLVAAVAPSSDGAASNPTGASVAADPRPNIVVITTDDMRVSDLQAMPTVRNLLGSQGTTFANSYASFPLCCPSRATMLTGQYAHNHGVLGNGSPVGGYVDFDPSSTFATWIRSAGYQTAMVGKFINGYGAVKPVRVPPGWQDWHGELSGGNYTNTRLFENGTAHQYTGPYQTDLFANISTGILQSRLPNDAPLFLWSSFFAPHVGLPTEPDDPAINTPAVAPRHRNAFAASPLPKSDPSFNEADVSDKPSYVRNKNRLTTTLQAQMTESHQQRLESLMAVDEGIDKMLDAIAASGELANTVIVFTSDNGWMMGEHRLHAGKGVVYEPSVKVPLIIRGPGFPAGATRNQLVANVDLAPTFADLADTQPGLAVDGVSLLPIAASDTGGPSRALLFEVGPLTAGGPMFLTAIRTDRWLYAEYPGTGEKELYDMLNDPFQLVSQARNPNFASIRDSLAQRLAGLRTCSGTGCR
jgi:N-acetylglucosamine-6-sulfatase